MSTDIFYIEILKSVSKISRRRPQMMKTTPKSRFVCKRLHTQRATHPHGQQPSATTSQQPSDEPICTDPTKSQQRPHEPNRRTTRPSKTS